MPLTPLPVFDDVLAAAARVKHLAIRTPLLRNDALDEAVGSEVFVKPECLQVTGSFKIRGATNRISQITDPEQKRAGVVAFSSGNHAQGVSRAAKVFGMPSLIVMPSDAPKVKVEGVRRDGGEVVFYDRLTESREEIGGKIAEERGAVIVPSYDDPFIIAGQGTVGLEVAEELDALGTPLDHYISCAGGGGLMAGSSLVFKQISPETKIWAAEPVGFDDHKKSIEAGEICGVDPDATSICDAIMTPQPGDLTFAINKHNVSGGFAVSDDQVREAMRFAFKHLKLVVEPGGCVALASALYALPDEMKGKRIGLVLSGGNVDAGVFAGIMSAG
ncbi:MAG: threonine/serine dehydratase [Hyphomonadaceae bacterium]